jgi:hypothetical protein
VPPQKVAPPCCLDSVSEAEESFEGITVSALTVFLSVLVIAEVIAVFLIAMRYFEKKRDRQGYSE